MGVDSSKSVEHFSGLKSRKQQWEGDTGMTLNRPETSQVSSSEAERTTLLKRRLQKERHTGGVRRDVGLGAAEGGWARL